jgi:hypothetical protein
MINFMKKLQGSRTWIISTMGYLFVSIQVYLVSMPVTSAQTSFRPAVEFTSPDDPVARNRLARNPQDTLLWNTIHGLTLIYWQGLEQTTENDPSRIFLRQWDQVSGWHPRQQVDQSMAGTGETLGGRIPSVILDANQALHVFWHDHRHGSAGASWNDNSEIYTDRFTSQGLVMNNLRLTDSGNVSSGDNGFNPRPTLLMDGRVALAWYDFHWDVNTAEITLRLSNPDGSWSLTPPDMDSVRLTTPADRAPGDENQPFTVPDISADANGILHLCWVTGTTGAPTSLYTGRYDPDAGTWLGMGLHRTKVSGFFDPPRWVEDPNNDDRWLMFVDRIATGSDEVLIQKLAGGSSTFDPEIQVTNTAGLQQQPSAVIDSSGIFHMVHVDTAPPQRSVRYTRYDPQTTAVEEEVNLTSGLSGTWNRPVITMDADGDFYLAWEDSISLTEGQLYFTTTLPVVNGSRAWRGYQ